MDLAWWTKARDDDGDGAKDDEDKKSPTLEENCERAEASGNDDEADIPDGIVIFDDVFFGVPRNWG